MAKKGKSRQSIVKDIERAKETFPEEVRVVGFDGISLGRYTTPPLSSIVQDISANAEIMAEEITRLLSGTSTPRHVVIPVSYIRRGSTHPD